MTYQRFSYGVLFCLGVGVAGCNSSVEAATGQQRAIEITSIAASTPRSLGWESDTKPPGAAWDAPSGHHWLVVTATVATGDVGAGPLDAILSGGFHATSVTFNPSSLPEPPFHRGPAVQLWQSIDGGESVKALSAVIEDERSTFRIYGSKARPLALLFDVPDGERHFTLEIRPLPATDGGTVETASSSTPAASSQTAPASGPPWTTVKVTAPGARAAGGVAVDALNRLLPVRST